MGGEDRGAHTGHHAVALRAQRIKVFCPAFLQKSGRGPGAEPLAARRSARNSLVLHKAQEVVKGGTLAGGSPFAGGPAARSLCASPLKSLQGTASSTFRTFVYRGANQNAKTHDTPVGAGFQRRPGVGGGWAELAVLLAVDFALCCDSTPFLWCLPKETGWSPKERRLGWWRPREVSGPTRLSHSRGRCHSAAKVSASRTDWITRPRGEGFGLAENWRLKVFSPAFLQKSGRGPGAEPWPRAAARGTLLC